MLFPHIQSSILITFILFPHHYQTLSPSYLKCLLHPACTLCSLHPITSGHLIDLLIYTLSLLNMKVHFYSFVNALPMILPLHLLQLIFQPCFHIVYRFLLELMKGIFYPTLENGCRSYIDVQYFLHLISAFNTNDDYEKHKQKSFSF